ncbi:hypothetical protein E4K10_01095 [Streptomyces sp. T1317-0309]|nr:hypothetical protein E4K10_01095 [Streptomyces sp. T1317-0309]
MATQRGNSSPDGQQEGSTVRLRVIRLIATFLAAIPFAAVLNIFQDWLGDGISASQTGLLIGVLVLLAFLVYATMGTSSDTAREGQLTRAELRRMRESMEESFDEFRDRTGASIRYYRHAAAPRQGTSNRQEPCTARRARSSRRHVRVMRSWL